MLPEVHLGRRSACLSCRMENYRWFVGDDLMDEINSLAGALKGIRVCEISSTAYG